MKSLKDELKTLDLEKIKARVSMISSTNKIVQDNKEYRCKICKDEEGFIVRVKLSENPFDYRDDWQICECKKERSAERLMKSSKITPEFQRKTFENFIQDKRPLLVQTAYKAAYNYVQDLDDECVPNKSIALLGRPGCGKTHLLMAISNILISKRTQVLYFPFVEGFNEIKSNLDTLETRIHQMQQAQVLYIDDLFKGRKDVTDFVIEQVFAIINYRYLEKKPILISSEKTIAGLCEIDEGIGSRINEMCRDYKVVLQGGIELNYRLQ